MARLISIFVFSLLVVVTCDLGLGVQRLSAADRPNILWLTSEDHGPQMGCYGDQLARTPRIDRLAARGMAFQRAWSVVPVCAPARTAIITGLYPSSTGALHMRSMVPLPATIRLLPQQLRAAGYYCSNNSKEDYNIRVPDPIWDDSSPRASWRMRGRHQPFFAVFNSTKSHESQIRTRPHRLITRPDAVRVPIYHPDTPEVRADWAQYYDQVSEADADAGVWLDALENDQLTEDTIIFYFADHGSGMPRSKRWPGNSGLHVPMVVYFPPKWQHLAPKEYREGGRSDRLVSFVDLAPTVLSLAGIRPPDWMQGHAFAGNYQTTAPSLLHGERGRMDERLDLSRSTTDGQYVYIRNFYPQFSQGQWIAYQFETPTTRIWNEWFKSGRTSAAQSAFWTTPKAVEELYDLTSDPDEVKNLAQSPDYQLVLDRFRAAQREHMLRIRDVCLLPEPEMHARSTHVSPYELAHNEDLYPIEQVLTAALLASRSDLSEVKQLTQWLSDQESGVRYWAVIGLQIRGREAVQRALKQLETAMDDPSPSVQVAAAHTLVTCGDSELAERAVDRLAALVSPQQNGVLIAMSALTAIEALGTKASRLHSAILSMPQQGNSPDPRYDPYVPRLVKNIQDGRRSEP